jgi:DNA-3-methyladenine glycosylase I
MARCPWAEGDALMARYHDEEWGVPVHDPRLAFEHLILETFQAGLSWRVVLGKREAFRRAFAGFDPHAMAALGPEDVERLAQDATLIRNRAKLAAAASNARAFLAMEEEGPGFVPHVWSYVGGRPRVHHWTRSEDVPATDPVATELARDLKERGFRFVGPTVMYAHMQATGVVNDHLVGCPRHAEVAADA